MQPGSGCFCYIGKVSEDLIHVEKNGKARVMNKNGQFILKSGFDHITDFSQDQARYKKTENGEPSTKKGGTVKRFGEKSRTNKKGEIILDTALPGA